MDVGIDFVKHFRAHLGNIQGMVANISGSLLYEYSNTKFLSELFDTETHLKISRISISNDKNAKVFDVVNFDMINIISLGFVPQCVVWIHQASDAIPCVAISDSETSAIHVYDGRGGLLKSLEKIHFKPVTCMAYNHLFDTVISADASGIVEYW
jgi:peptidylprolyl isomerase domain and WD repeat-containing protein 1